MTTGEGVASAAYLYGAPIVAALPAHVRGVGAAHAAGYVYDYLSSASSSSSYQQNGGAGGTLPRPKRKKPIISQTRIDSNIKKGNSMAATTERACGIGYRLKKVRGKWMCVPKSSKKSRSR